MIVHIKYAFISFNFMRESTECAQIECLNYQVIVSSKLKNWNRMHLEGIKEFVKYLGDRKMISTPMLRAV
jgi:hypothetical protein